MRIQFGGTIDADAAADAFILAFVASRTGAPVSGKQVWKSLRSRGLVPTDGRRTAGEHPDEGAAVAEVQRRLDRWRRDGLVGGESNPEAVTGNRFYWALGKAPA